MQEFKNEIKKAILIREVENSFLNLFSQGKLNGTVHTCVGQEFIGAILTDIITNNDIVSRFIQVPWDYGEASKLFFS